MDVKKLLKDLMVLGVSYAIDSIDLSSRWLGRYSTPDIQLPKVELPKVNLPKPERSEERKLGEKSGFSKEEAREYTRKRTIEHLVAVEDHLRSVGEETSTCIGCLLEHHFPALRMYAKEGLKFCEGDECEAYRQLAKVVEEVEKSLLEGKVDQSLAEKFREVRKALSPAGEVLKKIMERVEEVKKLEGYQLSTAVPENPVEIVEPNNCLHEVRKYVLELAPKVAKEVGASKPIRLELDRGVVVKDGRESISATNPDTEPVKQLYNCDIWSKLSEEQKKKVVAHELAHAFGIRDEYKASEVADKVVSK